MVGDGHAMGVSAEILEHIVGAAEGWFGVDDPVFSEQRSEPGSEDLGLREQSQITGEVQLVTLKSGLESGDELAAKHASEYLDGEKEARVGSDPASVIEREPAGRDDTVYVGMKLEFLVPSVKHAEEAPHGGNLMEEEWGCRPGAVDENRGPHLTSALLIPPSERVRCTDFDPGPLARPPSHFLSVRRFLTVRTWRVGPGFEKFSRTHRTSALLSSSPERPAHGEI